MLDYNMVENNINIKEKFIEDFKTIFNKKVIEKSKLDVEILCIGTDRIIGDSFGPLVGSKLLELFEKCDFANINIYGSLENNLNYEGIENILKRIDKKTTIIVLDAALSNKENIGKIFVSDRKMILGKGLAKNKVEIGDISIKTVVAKDYKIPTYNFKALQNISLSGVMALSNIVAEGIFEVIKSY